MIKGKFSRFNKKIILFFTVKQQIRWIFILSQSTFLNSFHREVYLGERNSRLIFQSVLMPEEANFIISFLMLLLILSRACISKSLLAEAEKVATPCLSIKSFAIKKGPAISTPRIFASSLREIMQPSLLLKTTTGFLESSGRKTLSHEQ